MLEVLSQHKHLIILLSQRHIIHTDHVPAISIITGEIDKAKNTSVCLLLSIAISQEKEYKSGGQIVISCLACSVAAKLAKVCGK